jgi:hypothetical protein
VERLPPPGPPLTDEMRHAVTWAIKSGTPSASKGFALRTDEDPTLRIVGEDAFQEWVAAGRP